MHHDIGRQFLECPEVVSERLFHEMALLDASCPDVTLEQVAPNGLPRGRL